MEKKTGSTWPPTQTQVNQYIGGDLDKTTGWVMNYQGTSGTLGAHTKVGWHNPVLPRLPTVAKTLSGTDVGFPEVIGEGGGIAQFE